MTFDRYAAYYDLLYQDKDYEDECDFLEQIFAVHAQRPIRSILDLGCGTGNHALPLGRRGYVVTGVDCSEDMLNIARSKVAGLAAVGGQRSVVFHQGDIRTLDLGQTFDAVIAMFAVFSYQTTNEDLAAAFRTARRHLQLDGLFVFDCWFGPAVLTQKPTARYKVVEREGERIIRFATPTLDIVQHTVRVNYKILRLKNNQVLDEVNESHLMRFLFPQELAVFYQHTDFDLLRIVPFMNLHREVTVNDWNVTVIARAR